MPKPSETKTIWNSETMIFLTAKVPNWAINCSYLDLSTSSVLRRCMCNMHPTPIPFECASQTAQSAHWHSTTSYHCDPCLGWPRLELLTQRGAETRGVDHTPGCSRIVPTPQLWQSLNHETQWDLMRLHETFEVLRKTKTKSRSP